MKKLENKKILIILAIIIVFILIITIKLIDQYFEQNNKTNIGLLNQIIKEKSEDELEEIEKIIIYITGEVANPGVYELEEGSRISNAIDIAGGITENANIKNVNLAYELEDGEKIYIPNISEETEEIVLDGQDTTTTNNISKKININKATINDLLSLSGIGETTAQSIIKYREENGKFKSPEDLLNVSGIGEAKLENIRDKIEIK